MSSGRFPFKVRLFGHFTLAPNAKWNTPACFTQRPECFESINRRHRNVWLPFMSTSHLIHASRSIYLGGSTASNDIDKKFLLEITDSRMSTSFRLNTDRHQAHQFISCNFTRHEHPSNKYPLGSQGWPRQSMCALHVINDNRLNPQDIRHSIASIHHRERQIR